MTPSTAQFHAGGRRPRGAFPVCVAFEPLNSPSAFLWASPARCPSVGWWTCGGQAPFSRPSAAAEFRPPSRGHPPRYDGTFRPHRRALIVLRQFPASQCSTGEIFNAAAPTLWAQLPTSIPRGDSALVLQGQQGLSPPAVAYECAAGWQWGTCRMYGCIVNFYHAKQPNMGFGSAMRAPRAWRSHGCGPRAEIGEATWCTARMCARHCEPWAPKASTPLSPQCPICQV